MNKYPGSVYVKHIRYRGYPITPSKKQTNKKSIEVIGIDTEAYNDGKCFMIATSEGDVYDYEDFPQCLFNRKYRNTTFVAYNLGYDMGHFVSWVPKKHLRELWANGETVYNEYKVKTIAKKFLRITRNSKDSITFYDMYNFYRGAGVRGGSSLDSVAQNILGETKIDIGTKSFTRTYVKRKRSAIAKYCIQDAVLVKKLADRLITQFESWGVYPRALYSTAYVTYQFFSTNTKYVIVKRFWDKHRMLLDYAMQAYNGGKFEVTRKGSDMYYEYDIVSAYPYEIANLVDISRAMVVYSKKYDDSCTYAFIKCILNIPECVYSPVAIKYGAVNIYPVGVVVKVITKTEYHYMLSIGVKIDIIDCYMLVCGTTYKPYEKEILKLFEYKKLYKNSGDVMLYHTIKILLNSLYGKFVQLIKHSDHLSASTCWNPIYGAIITANTRVRVSQMQQQYKSVVAVHTDSIISTEPINIITGHDLGDWAFERSGYGVILGSGIYQIGKTSKYRGFHSNRPLLDICRGAGETVEMVSTKTISWREAAWRGYDNDQINRFVADNKHLNISFDHKRLWPNDYKTFGEALCRHAHSTPHFSTFLDSLSRTI